MPRNESPVNHMKLPSDPQDLYLCTGSEHVVWAMFNLGSYVPVPQNLPGLSPTGIYMFIRLI